MRLICAYANMRKCITKKKSYRWNHFPHLFGVRSLVRHFLNPSNVSTRDNSKNKVKESLLEKLVKDTRKGLGASHNLFSASSVLGGEGVSAACLSGTHVFEDTHIVSKGFSQRL